MKKIFTLAGILFVMYDCAQAQYTRYIVQLTDKKGTTFSLSNPAAFLSARAIDRRSRQHIPYDSTDLPVSKAYVDSIRKVPNVTILNISKWLNQVAIQTTDANAIATINTYPFVKKTAGIAPRVNLNNGEPIDEFQEAVELPRSNNRVSGVQGDSAHYGNMYKQIHIHEGDYLHNLGFTGKGVVIAVFDVGFMSYKTNPVFDSVRLQGRVLGEWDYVANESSVNEDNSHGAYVLSCMASNRPGVLVGSAPHASYWLLRTESISSEYPIEEHNWVVAAEFADSAGADMINSSLGYDLFDDASFNHSYAQRNGNTAMVTIGADIAVKKGILVVNAAGNTGSSTNDRKYVSCPADGDSVLAVGSIDVSGNIAPSSSWGPNGAGLLKPNVVSVGQNAVVATLSGNPGNNTGTSFACPNLAGLIACLWQAFPEFTNMEIFNEVQRSANKFSNPDFRFGHGIPNFRKAYEQLLVLRSIREKETNTWLKAYPVPAPGNTFKLLLKAPASGKASIHLINVMGQVINIRVVEVSAGQIYIIDYNNVPGLARGVYYIRYNDGSNKHTLPILRQ
jgi:serine protease AprX